MATEEKNILNDDDIRSLVLARLSTASSDTMKVIGNEGAFTRDQLMEHVKAGDKIGNTIAEIEIEWLRALKGGLKELYE
jgi:hypothetical protein